MPNTHSAPDHHAQSVAAQEQWIAEHGGSLTGYVARYGAQADPTHFGNGGEAIYVADMAELQRRQQQQQIQQRHQQRGSNFSGTKTALAQQRFEPLMQDLRTKRAAERVAPVVPPFATTDVPCQIVDATGVVVAMAKSAVAATELVALLNSRRQA